MRLIALLGGWIAGVGLTVAVALAVVSVIDVGPAGVWVMRATQAGIIASFVGALLGVWLR